MRNNARGEREGLDAKRRWGHLLIYAEGGRQPPWLSLVGLFPHGAAGQGGEPANSWAPFGQPMWGVAGPFVLWGGSPLVPPLSGEALLSELPF